MLPEALHENRKVSLLGGVKGRLLKLSPKEASFAGRGFPGSASESREHLESVIRTFIEGYNMAVDDADAVRLAHRLDSSFSPAFVGFAYEGAGLYFSLLDLMLPRSKSRLNAFTHSAGARHDFIAYLLSEPVKLFTGSVLIMDGGISSQGW